MRHARTVTHLVEFTHGFPDGNIVWTLYNPDGTVIDTDIVTPTPNSVSVVISVPSTLNELAVGDMIGGRELSWTYEVDGIERGGEFRYTLERSIPFPVTPQGVRDKLGIEQHELPDETVPLMDAYLEYGEQVDLDAIEASGTSREIRLIVNALEAIAALNVLPTLQVRIAASEESGTNIYSRYAKVDWEAIRAQLRAYVAAASAEFAPSTGSGLFSLAGPATDAITGETVG